jgi:hypothetical protein
MKPRKLNDRQAWIDARKRHGLSHAEVQMARELGMNPKKLGKLDNRTQEPWSAVARVHPTSLFQAVRQGTSCCRLTPSQLRFTRDGFLPRIASDPIGHL